MDDEISRLILATIAEVAEPLETKEIEEKIREHANLRNATRSIVFYRLQNLRGEGKIKGKFVGPGKGVWVWWAKKEVEYGKKE